jgi:thiol-disulfide isomerase/thioredoxin
MGYRVLLAAAAACAAGVVGRADGPAKGVDAPEVRAADLEKAIKDHKGKVVLIDCWATWCAPCVKKFPQLVGLSKKYADQGLVVVGVSMDKYGDADGYQKEKVVKFLGEKGAAFPNFVAAEPKKDEEALTKLLGDYSAIPHMALYDRAGRRVWTSDELPKLKDGELEKKLEAELAKKP